MKTVYLVPAVHEAAVYNVVKKICRKHGGHYVSPINNASRGDGFRFPASFMFESPGAAKAAEGEINSLTYSR